MLITESCNSKPSLETLDPFDLALVAELVARPRTTGRDLAALLEVSEASISRRLAQLREEGVVRFHGFVPPHFLGMHSAITLYIDTDGDPGPPAIALAKLPHLHFVATVADRNEIVAFMLSPSGEAATERIDRDVVTIPGVVAVRSAPMLHYFTPQPSRRVESNPPNAGRLREHGVFDSADRAMILVAQRDGRSTVASLAAAAGLSPAAAGERFQKLLDSGALTILCCTAPARLGRRITAILRMQIRGPIGPSATAIDRLTGASYVVVAGGDWQISVEVDVKDEEELAALAATIRELHCVVGMQVLPLRAVLKDTYDWGAPDCTGR